VSSARSRSLSVALAVLDAPARVRAAFLACLVAAERIGLVVLALGLASGRIDRVRAWGLASALGAAWAARAWMRASLRVRVQARLHRGAADALLGADPVVSTPLEEGDSEVVLLEGVHHGSVLVAERVPSLAGDLAAACVITLLLLVVAPARVLVVGAAGAALAALVAFALRRVTSRAQDAAWSAYRPLLDRMLVAARGRAELVANGAERRFASDLDVRLGEFERVTRSADRLSGIAGRAPLVAAALGVAIAVVAQGGAPSLSSGALADAALLAAVLPAFVGLAQSAHETFKLTLAFRPMAALLALPRATSAGIAPPAAPVDAVSLKHVVYRYPGASRDALAGVSLAFGRGVPLVLSGPNGSGKSTVLRLLARLAVPDDGEIVVGGVDLARLDAVAWRRSVAYLPQQPHLPEAMTVAETMRLLAPDATDADLAVALRRVEVLDALAARAKSSPLALRIGELSAGQKKRVALARVLLKPADLVLLDEPDANLDAAGVGMVARLIAELARTRLVAVAAHTPGVVAAPGVHIELAA